MMWFAGALLLAAAAYALCWRAAGYLLSVNGGVHM